MDEKLSRKAISAAVDPLGWRFVLGVIRTCVPVGSLAQSVDVMSAVYEPAAEGKLRFDFRDRYLVLTLQGPEIDLARRITETLHGMGLRTVWEPVQMLEIAIDATDIAAVRPFWKAILGYIDETPDSGPTGAIIDPLGLQPAIWFQQMSSPRPGRNRVHFDVCVPPEQAQQRIRAAIEGGGTLRYDAEAPAFWVLADAEGNEACITTWEGRDDD
jgi:4a-hydroxytetrahydrobiopterin dehydratase